MCLFGYHFLPRRIAQHILRPHEFHFLPGEALRHDLDRLRVAIRQQKAPPQFEGRGPGRTTPREEVRDHIAGVGGGLNDPAENAEGFLGGIAGFFFARGADDGMPPRVGWGLPPRGLLRADEAGGRDESPGSSRAAAV